MCSVICDVCAMRDLLPQLQPLHFDLLHLFSLDSRSHITHHTSRIAHTEKTHIFSLSFWKRSEKKYRGLISRDLLSAICDMRNEDGDM